MPLNPEITEAFETVFTFAVYPDTGIRKQHDLDKLALARHVVEALPHIASFLEKIGSQPECDGDGGEYEDAADIRQARILFSTLNTKPSPSLKG
jgi:hypothetical protein